MFQHRASECVCVRESLCFNIGRECVCVRECLCFNIGQESVCVRVCLCFNIGQVSGRIFSKKRQRAKHWTRMYLKEVCCAIEPNQPTPN